MDNAFSVTGLAGDVMLRVSGVLQGQSAGPATPPRLLVADSPPGGTDNLVVLPLASAERSHEAVLAAVLQSEQGAIPPDAERAELVIRGQRWPGWVTKEPSLAPRFVARLWLGIWPAQPGAPGVVLLRARDINANDDPLQVLRGCRVLQSMRVDLG